MKNRILAAVVTLFAVTFVASAQSKQPILQPHQTFLDASGLPCAGCALWSYAAGTTTPLATYTDASGNTQNTNPIILNAAGGADIWIGSSAYKFVLVDTLGTTIWTADQVMAPISGNAGNPVVTNPTGDQTINQASGKNFSIDTSGGGQLLYNGNPLLQATPLGNQTVTQPTGTTLSVNSLTATNFTATNLAITGNTINTGTALTAFGDSITVGYGLSSPSTQNYAAQWAALKGWTFTNDAVSGSWCIDQSQSVIQQSPVAGSNYSWMLGFNDARGSGSTAANQAAYHACAQGELSWLAIPAVLKELSTSGTTTGTWITSSLYGSNWLFSSTNGSTLTLGPSTVGDSIEVWFLGQVSNTTTFTISVDGQVQACHSVSNICADSTTFEASLPLGSALGASFGMQGVRLPGAVYAGHVITITIVSGDPSFPLGVFGASVYDAGFGSKTGPQVFVGNLPRMNAAGYANNSCPTTCNLANDTVQSEFDTRLHSIVSDLASDGLQVTLVDVGSYSVYDPNISAQVQADNIHPTLLGATQIAAQWNSESTSASTVRDRGASQILKNATSYNNSLYMSGIPAVNGPGELGAATSPTGGTLRLGTDGGGLIRNGSNYSFSAVSGPASVSSDSLDAKGLGVLGSNRVELAFVAGVGYATSFGADAATVGNLSLRGSSSDGSVTDSYLSCVHGAACSFSRPVIAPSINTGATSNTDLAGQLTLSGGTATYSFTKTYATAPICTATDTTAAAAVKASATTSVLTLTGTATDVLNYICIVRT